MWTRAEIAAHLGTIGVEGSAREAEAIERAAGGNEAEIDRILEARAAGVPLAYVLGRTTFLGVELVSAPGALAPREETELLGRKAIELANEAATTRAGSAVRVIDMCCGSGNLACALATHVPRSHVWASDLTDGCVELTRRNVAQLGLAEAVTVVQGDLFAPLASAKLEESIDVIVCNPPYISAGKLEGSRAPLLAHEPREAFDGGPYGLSIHQRVIKDALGYLREGGVLLFEIGVGQERQLRLLFERARAYREVELVSDGGGHVRVVVAQKASSRAAAAGTAGA